MQYPKIDLHGYTVEEAMTQFHLFIGHHMVHWDTDYVEIITGNGIIKERVIEELDSLEMDWMIQAHNLGRIIVTIKDD